jgi:epoxyqueuosine reductase
VTLDGLATAAHALHLTPLGGFHEGETTTILLGPFEPGFWTFVTKQPEFSGADPLDNWSTAAISTLAENTGSQAFFPFGGPPYHPFISWALHSGETWQSPVGLLVHKDAELLVSYRGALRFDWRIDLPVPAMNPCDTCADKPCLTACPVLALSLSGYDVPSCKAHIDTDARCRKACRVRMACPVSQTYSRDPAQTAFHMEAFHPS